MKTRFPPALRVAGIAAFVVAILLLVGVGVSAVTTPACTSCHASQAKAVATQKPGHPTTSCVRCHVREGIGGRLSFGVDQVFGMVLHVKSLDDRAMAAVPDSTCASCHAPTKGVTSGRLLKIDHSACAAGAACTDCHAGTAHQSTVRWQRLADMSSCLSCHNQKNQSVACDTCHVSKSIRARLATGSIWILHGKNWRTTHAMGNMKVCGACHQTDFCGRCHGVAVPHDAAFRTDHGAASRSADARCMTCHKRSYCDSCHGIEMPHPADFKPNHSKIVGRSGDTSCKRCHAASDCSDCHIRHIHPGGAV